MTDKETIIIELESIAARKSPNLHVSNAVFAKALIYILKQRD